LAEVQHVTGVPAEDEDHAGAVLRGAGHRADLLRGGGGEQVAHRCAVRHTGPDQPAEGRVVSRPAADDDGDCPRSAIHRAHHTALDATHSSRIRHHEAVQHLLGECGGVVEQTGHGESSLPG
jgi:hypothetical protein